MKSFQDQQKDLSKKLKAIRNQAKLERFRKEVSIMQIEPKKTWRPKGASPPAFYIRTNDWELHEMIELIAAKLSMNKQEVGLCALMELVERVKK